MNYINRKIKAISPVLVVLMMIAVAIAGSLVTYAWVRGYIDFSTEKMEQTIVIQSIANDPTDTDLLVYVQNVGEGIVQLEEDTCLYVNGALVKCTIAGVTVSDKVATLNQGDVATLRYSGGAALLGEKVEVKVVSLLGGSSEYFDYPAGTAYDSSVLEQPAPSVLDHFEFDLIESPQTSGTAFSITIRAVDHYGKHFVGYAGVNNLTYSHGEISPTTTGGFLYGVWTGEVTVTGSANGTTITAVAQSDLYLTGTSNTFDVVDVPSSFDLHILFEDDFESYTVGTFPSSGGWDLWYNGMGTEYQVIVDSVSNSPTQSFKLLGSHSANWGAFAAHPITTDSPLIGFNVSVRVDSLGSGDRDIARVCFGTEVPPVYDTGYAPILFTDYGTIKGCGTGDLQSYVADRWYKVTVILNRNSETYSVWVDGVLIGENLTVWTNRGPMEPGETSWDVEAFVLCQKYHSKNAYFDDIVVFTVE